MTDESRVTLRRATSGDVDSVFQLICELAQTRFDEEAFRAGYLDNLNTPHLYYALACADEQVLGFVSVHLQYHLHHVGWIAEIQELVISPRARGRGIGKRLLAWAEETAKYAGAQQTELSTSTRRHDAHRFYQREGYLNSHLRFTKPLTER